MKSASVGAGMARRVRRFWAPPLLAVAVACTAVSAQAQSASNPAAESLFDEGLRLFDAGRYGEACAKFAASQKLEPASGTSLNLARCYEKVKRTASAWATYREVQALARKEGNTKREASARTHEKALAGKLATLTITAPSPAPPGLVIRRDDADVDAGEWQSAIPVDPGVHVVEASAPGKKPWSQRIEVADAAASTVAVPALEALPAPAVVVAPVEPPPQGPPRPEPAPEGLSTPRLVALGVGGVAVVALGVATVTGLGALSKANQAKSHCAASGVCDDTGTSLRSDARAGADLSTVAFTVGAVLATTAVVIWFAAPSRPGKTGIVVSPTANAFGGGLVIAGSL